MKKKRAKVSKREDVRVVVRNWKSVPARLRRMMVNIAFSYELAEKVRFPTPAGSKWESVEIVLLTPEWVRVRVRRVTRTYTFGRIGLADMRRPGTPRAEWRMLRTYAENTDPGAYYRLPSRPTLKMDISRFRRWLKFFFGIAGDPLKPFFTDKWMPKFKIRSAAK